MKTICSSSHSINLAVIQVCREGKEPVNYSPTPESWKRFTRLYLNFCHGSGYKTFAVKSSAGFKTPAPAPPRKGRPTFYTERMKSRPVFIPPECAEWYAAQGDGNLSAGLRRVWEQHANENPFQDDNSPE